MPSTRFCRYALVALFLATTVGTARDAVAQPRARKARATSTEGTSGPRNRAIAYAARNNNLPTREISVKDKNGRLVKRLFVPVLKHTQPDFLKNFSSDKNTVIWRHHDRDHIHAHIMLAEQDHVGYMRPPHHDFSNEIGADRPGKYVVMELSSEEIDHMVKRFELLGKEPMHTRKRGREIVGEPNHVDTAGCMWWLVHAETAPGVNLGTALDAGRSAAPENLIRKILHQAGTRVSVVGVPVRDVEEFRKMTDEMLLGPKPKSQRGDP